MSAVLKPVRTERSLEEAFSDSQKLPLEKRGVTFDALFYRQLQQVTVRIHETENLEQIMLESSQDICKLFNADRLTLYAVSDDKTSIISKIKMGLNSASDLKLPMTPQSLAGYAAFSRKLVNVADVYDEAALKRIHPHLAFLKAVDKRSGYRTREMLVAPILDGETLYGVLQVINNKSGDPFGSLEVDGILQLCKTLATAIRQRLQKPDDVQKKVATKYDGLLADGALTLAELQQCLQDARGEGRAIELAMLTNHKITPAQIGPSLATFFGVPY